MTQRPIKFRFVEDFGTPYAKVFPITEEGITACLARNKDDQYGHTVDEYLHRFFFDPFPNVLLEQFTGLLDKNGKEIYEGDILACKNDQQYQRHPSVAVIDPLLGFGTRLSTGEWNGLLSTWLNHGAEVIGNIHENPDLLNQP